MKTNTLFHRIFLLAALVGIVSGFALLTKTSSVSAAAPPGCYMKEKTGNTYVAAGSDCVSVKGYKSDKCYAANFGSTDFKETACSGITLVQTQPLSNALGPTNGGAEVCGTGDQAVKISIKIGCTRKSANPILDAFFALLRFASVGVGVVLAGAAIVVGIQYSFSRGDPGATAKAKAHLTYIAIALLTYIFSFALLNFLVPGGLLS
jgi:hypothetical protein